MTENTSAVDANLGVATDPAGVETTPKAPEVDTDLLESVLQTAIETRNKAIQNAENWKKVGMARKNAAADGSIPELTEDDIEQRANLRAQEILTKEATTRAEQAEAIALKALKDVRELRIAAKNKVGVVTTAPVAASGTTTVPVGQGHGWSNDQIADMKRRGFDTSKEMLQKSWERYKKNQ